LSKKLKIPMPNEHPLRNHPTARTPSDKGFALVVTLSLMLLLLFTVIAVDLLFLSSILLRSSTQDQAVGGGAGERSGNLPREFPTSPIKSI
jgi:hypothetical protein